MARLAARVTSDTRKRETIVTGHERVGVTFTHKGIPHYRVHINEYGHLVSTDKHGYTHTIDWKQRPKGKQ